jgi:basic membrane lipoprotein Med (substrate-binding protein (PBP1-ABC) superfamily)
MIHVLILLCLLAPIYSKPLYCAILISEVDVSVYDKSDNAETLYFSENNDDFDFKLAVIEPYNIDNITRTYQECGEAGAGIVSLGRAPVDSAWLPAAESYPNTQWVNIEANPSLETLSPVNTHWSIGFDWFPAYVKGYIAGATSKTGSVGMILAYPSLPKFVRVANAYYMGALAANPNINYHILATGTFLESLAPLAVQTLLSIDNNIDVIGLQMGTTAYQDYILNTPSLSHILITEDTLSLKLSSQDLERYLGNDRILTSTSFNWQPFLQQYADLFISNTLSDRTLLFTNGESKHNLVFDIAKVSDIIPSKKRNEINKVYKRVVENGEDPFCGEVAQELLGSRYQLINGCLSETDKIYGIRFIEGTDPTIM